MTVKVRKLPTGVPDTTTEIKGGYKVRFYAKGHTYWIMGGTGTEFPYPSWTWLRSITQYTPYAAGPPDSLVGWAVKEAVNAFLKGLLKHEDIPSGKILDALVKAAKAAPNATRDAAGEQGTKVHDLMERLAHGRKLPNNAEARKLDRFWRTLKVEPIGIEMVLAHPELGCAGTIDLYCKAVLPRKFLPDSMARLSAGPHKILLDYKTSNYVLKKHWAQLGGYIELLEREDHQTDGAVIVHIPRGNKDIEIYPQLDAKVDRLAFHTAMFSRAWHENEHLDKETIQWLKEREAGRIVGEAERKTSKRSSNAPKDPSTTGRQGRGSANGPTRTSRASSSSSSPKRKATATRKR